MNSSSERLRAMLDERGIEHVDADDGHTKHTWWSDGDHEIGACDSGERLAVYNLTPEQAIAATVGPTLDHDLQQALNFMRIWITDDAHLGESEISYQLEKAEGLRNLEAIEQAIAATVGADYAITFAPTLDRPHETMVGETVYDSEGNAIGWIANATADVGTCRNISDPPSGFLCSECGWGDFNEPSHLLTTSKFTDNDRGLNYCPNCGKRIEEVTE